MLVEDWIPEKWFEVNYSTKAFLHFTYFMILPTGATM